MMIRYVVEKLERSGVVRALWREVELKGTKATRNRLLSVAYTATWDLSCSQGHVWIHCPSASRVCVDVCGLR